MGFLDRFKTARDEEKTAPAPTDPLPTALPEGEELPSPAEEVLTVDPMISEPSEGVEFEAPVPDATVEEPFIDFESEFAPTEPIAQPEFVEPLPTVPVFDEAELEEWSEPLPSIAPPLLALPVSLESPEGILKVEEWLEARGGENVYRALLVDADSTEETEVRLREASGVWGERLSREAMWRSHWDATSRIPMLPRLICGFQHDETSYLATETPNATSTLGHFFAKEEAKTWADRNPNEIEAETAAFLSEVLLVTTQIAAFLVRLHGLGFAHLGLRPDGIVLGKPVQILDCSFAAPLGEALEAPLSFAGYSAPELSQPGVVDARADIYAVGALLYRAVTGSDVPESGPDFLTWKPRVVMAGVPQILRRTLGDVESRFNSAEEMHRALVKLKNRLRPT
ncbi:hypothetical protein EON80_02255, partial [bacterium]